MARAEERTIDQEFVALQQALAGEYSLERELGRGGMGIVYLARDVQLDRLVAIKVLPEHLAARAELRERFLREARTAAGLSHPNIVPIHRVGEVGAFVFFVMAYIDGETLGHRLREHGPLSAPAAARMLREVAWALAYAHGRGVIHRDIKPDNILLERETGRALVTDFGIAQVTAGPVRGEAGAGHDLQVLTGPEQVMGTAHFMSPEQAVGEPLDGRSDLYALGVVGYLALSGQLPFQAPTVPALLAKHLSEPAPALSTVAPAVPEWLGRTIDRCLRKDRESRFGGGEALADALEPASSAGRQLPARLRMWVQQRNPARSLYLAWSGVCSMVAAGELISMLTWSHAHMRGTAPRENILVPIGLALLPLIPSAVFQLRQAYRVLHAGYSLPDMRFALERWRAERREELAFEMQERLSLPLRILRIATYASVPAFALSVAAVMRLRGFGPWGPGKVVQAVLGTLFFSIPATIVACNALDVPLLPQRVRRAHALGTLRSRFWNSRVGAWTARLLSGRRQHGAPDQLVYRPTEMALGLAASELFATLPKAYRAQLHELPSVVEQLGARATALRARVQELAILLEGAEQGQPRAAPLVSGTGGERTPTTSLLSSVHGAPQVTAEGAPWQGGPRREETVDALRASHDQAKRDLAQAVSALESIRLDLLRLHGGATDLEPLTTVLDAAREIGRELGFLIEAQHEVQADASAARLDGRLPTPA
ncbi:MAG TPA: serine/threonine-protein kinase [Gemmatimonadaceae bacterium]|nr:serine/threonine-protein kinase [Gemmatimonadaceae bacterium]